MPLKALPMDSWQFSSYTSLIKMGTEIILAIRHLIVSVMIIILFLCDIAQNTTTPCPRQPKVGCKGPYVIRPAHQQKKSPQCRVDQQSAMMSCMQQCQADECCRAFGLNATGKCVTSNWTTETLHFVKETPDPVNLSCFQGWLKYINVYEQIYCFTDLC